MELTQDLADRDWPTRILLAVGLGIFALWSFRRGKRLRGVLTGLGAIALGYSASTGSDVGERLSEELDTQSTSETGRLRCAICDEPIVAGQARTPNEDDETVHEACLQAPA